MCQIEGSSCEGNFNCTDNTLGTVMFGGFTWLINVIFKY
jgi:hypothetical protein